ncbi:protein phosphatase CheZ [Succinivibrio dextrinosolvens]|uniref:protein phosphatase CheZ n=1 Tax=Succinivibrio dextrinosolvens TaxID=83771 RepID=UPI002479D0BB|nr:protein phosphatase CheZ [Succinivibrio dextrinosolvens]
MSREEHRKLTVADLEEIKDLLESGMQEQAEDKLLVLSKNFSQQKNDEVYEQVGNLTRDLHEAIKRFAEDERLRVIANVDMPRASERLTSIIQMTDAAASKTLDAVEACAPMVKTLNDSVEKLLPAWGSLMKGRINRDNFVSLCRNVDTLIHDTKDNATRVSEQLNVILLAQDYQDLTGQLIQNVITLVSEVEDKLLQFLTHFSDEEKNSILENSDAVNGITPQGPATGDVLKSDKIAATQDDVDDLLASLGF